MCSGAREHTKHDFPRTRQRAPPPPPPTQAHPEGLNGAHLLTGLALKCAEVLPEPDLRLIEFIAVVRSFRLLTKMDSQQAALAIDLCSRWICTASVRSQSSIDPRICTVVASLEAAGSDWSRCTRPWASALIGLEEPGLEDLVRQETGLTFAQLRKALVLRRVLQLLAHTGERVQQIAFEVGYAHPSQLDRDFRRSLDITPKAFRKLAQRGRARQLPRSKDAAAISVGTGVG